MCGLLYSQEFYSENGVDKFQQVVEVNHDKAETYKRLKLYLNELANKSKYVIDMDDPVNGILSYNERLPPRMTSDFVRAEPSYKVTIEIKDRKIRYTASPININENLAGVVLNRSMSEFSDSAYKEKEIIKKEEEVANEKRDKKRKQIQSQIEALRKELVIKSVVVDYVKGVLKNNVIEIRDYINKNSDW